MGNERNFYAGASVGVPVGLMLAALALAGCGPQGVKSSGVVRPVKAVAALTAEPYVGSQDLTCRDVTVRLGTNDTFAFLRGVTADQAQRDAMQHKALLCTSEAAWQAQQTPCALTAFKLTVTMLNLVTTRLGGADYEGKNLRSEDDRSYKNGEWFIDAQGRHYQAATQTAQKIRSCLLASNAARACASALTPASLEYLDLRVEDGRCVAGARFTLPPNEPYNDAVAKAGALSTRVVIPPLTAADKDLLHATHRAHQWVSDYFCGRDPNPPPAGIVSATHKAYEDACGSDATCRHFRQMKLFSGRVHPGWSKQDECTIRQMQDDAHQAWMQAQEKPEPASTNPYHRWIDSRLDGDDTHLKAHYAANWKDERKGCDVATSAAAGCFMLRPVCKGKLAACPSLPPQKWVEQYRAAHPQPVNHPAPVVM